MWIRRFFYILILAVSALFFVLYPHWIAWYLFILLLLIPLFDLVISLPGMLTRRVSLSAPYTLEQGGSGTLTVTTLSSGPFPAGNLMLRLRETNEDNTASRRVLCSSTRGGRRELMIDTSRGGITAFEIRRLKAVSILGLTAIPVRSGGAGVRVLILPAPVMPPRVILLPKAVLLRPKPGGGFSEEHDIRPYRPGDPVNSVHWKLTAKHDSLMIREALSPPPHSRLISVSTWKGPRERDLTLGRLRWVSEWLLKRGLSYYIRLGDCGTVSEITGSEDLIRFLHAALSDAQPVSILPPSRFTWVFRIDAREVT